MAFSSSQEKSGNSPGLEPLQFISSRETDLGKQDYNSETWHMSFRGFACPEALDPIRCLRTLSELCHLWLRPDLHTKEQILDQLVMEQFMISMPLELQVLVKESGVKSCKDLEEMLRNNRTPKTWSIVSFQGQEFLLRNSDVQMAESNSSDVDEVSPLPGSPCSPVSETQLENHQKVHGELQDLPETSETSRGQGHEVLLPEAIPGGNESEDLRPKQNLGENLMEEDREGQTKLKAQESPLPKGLDSMRAKDGKNPEEGIYIKNVNADIYPTHVLESEVSPQSGNREESCRILRSSKRRKPDNTSISQGQPQEGAKHLDQNEFLRQTGLISVNSPTTTRPTSYPAGQGKEATGAIPYQCAVCKKGFQYKSQFNIHQRTHTGERPFKCNSCGRGFMQPSDLRVHQRIHTGEKPYRCELCHKEFTHESTLHGHKRIHTKEKPYECKDCGKCFSHRGNLNVHQRIHSGMKPYKCLVCSEIFRQLGTFKRHLTIHSRKTSQ
ncbi:zinc finger and SCAN domain-containing protein 5B-like [Choloepus didactylus]|uniref:zinc finger and SCAN domain-containing protein 5B-like n=1 Tax=Choloepus didactylus TaxID=27675 RepID=UPI00189D455A|nr:zinc finger and SCAN domain-containing protein 5B-like [Choloepus didactylus]